MACFCGSSRVKAVNQALKVEESKLRVDSAAEVGAGGQVAQGGGLGELEAGLGAPLWPRHSPTRRPRS